MKDSNKINFFGKKNTSCWFFFIPLITIFLISIALIIATSWYSIDYQIAAIFAKGLNFEFLKYWSRFYDQLGNTELIVILIIYLTLTLESWFLTKIAAKKSSFKKNYWIINSYYIVIFLVWIIANITNIALMPTQNNGFGKNIDFILIDDLKYQLTGASIAFVYQTILLALGLYYIRYHLVKTERILTEQFWIKVIKAIGFGLITYLIILITKGGTARLYYYNAIFGDLIKTRPDLLEIYQNSGFKYGYDNGQGFINNIPWDLQYPWWKSNINLLHQNQAMPRFSLIWEYAFPSGHINATFCTGSTILLFLKNKDNNKINWKIKLLFVVWLLHILSMNFALIVERFHWISDTAFTFILSILMIWIVNLTTNKIFYKKIK